MHQVSLNGPPRDVQPGADLRVGQPVGDQGRDGLLGRGQAGPAGFRPAARAAAAAANAGLAQRRLGAGQVPVGVQLLVDGQCLLQQRARPVGVTLASERGAGVFAGPGQLQRPGPPW